jgi:ATP-dependent helicase HrpA
MVSSIPRPVPDLHPFTARFGEAMLIDRIRLVRRRRAIEIAAGDGKPFDRSLAALKEELERSIARRTRRAEMLPKPKLDQELPILARKEDIKQAIAENQVVVICGETGSGKTTQLPQICLELGRGIAGMIGHTQPRRIAARTVAARIADELGTELGRGPVGYKVRFGDRTGPDSFIKLMTDGILLAETQNDRWLEAYDTIIIDEAHERGLNIDFLLGFLKQLLPRRPELKLIITSATIDPERFANHFAGGGKPAPIIEVSGRTYPVEVRYRPLTGEEDDREWDQEQGILAAVDELSTVGSGDILVFLTGEREIRMTAEALRKHHPSHTEILPLYARLSAAEQMRVFAPHQHWRIVLATNVAETSLTVRGIRYVVDPGYARMSRYNHKTKVQRLPIEAISRASADQRKGRCGRVAAGVCIRLYSESDFQARDQFTEPEILRTNLASVILQMKALRLGAVEEFPFVEPPDSRMIKDGYETLHELGAIDDKGELTRLGSHLARLPIDPRIARMVLAAVSENSLREILVIAAALSIQDPRERPVAAAEKADIAHKQWHDENSDFLALLNLWKSYQENAKHLSHSKLRKWCQERFLSYLRMREWEDTHQQLHALLGDMGFHESGIALPGDGGGAPSEGSPGRSPVPPRGIALRGDDRRRRLEKMTGRSSEPRPDAGFDAIHRALLTGLLSNIGTRAETFEYGGGRGSKFNIFPGSGLFKKGPKWVMAAEIVQTTKLYARTVAKIQPEWIEALAAHLVKKSYSECHWSQDAGHAVAFERVTLFGIELVARRRVNYGHVDVKAARELFILHALVFGETKADWVFLKKNLALVDEVKELEAKARKADILIDREAMYAYYDSRLPDWICSVATMQKWRQENRGAEKTLEMPRELVMKRAAPEITPDQFPRYLGIAGTKLNIQYKLDPGGEDDGLTLRVPIEALIATDEARIEWLVPGLLQEKILALFRCLPKAFRKGLEPAPALAEECAKELKFGEGSLTDTLSQLIENKRGFKIPKEAWQPKSVPDHLKMLVIVTNERGKEIAHGRDMAEIKSRLAAKAKASFGKLAKSSFDRDGLKTWDFGDLSGSMEIQRSGLRLVAYPAIVDQGATVSLRLLDSAEEAAEATRTGLRRLFMLEAKDELSYHLRLIPGIDRMALHYATLGGRAELDRELTELICERVFLEGRSPIRTKAEFESHLREGWDQIAAAARETGELVSQILNLKQAIALRIPDRVPPAWKPAMDDIQDHLVRLMPKGFLRTTPYTQLREFPRYLNAVLVRLQKLENAGLARDARWRDELVLHWRRYTDVANQLAATTGKSGPPPDARQVPVISAYRWMLEEYRVSLFAQELGTATPVSSKRLEEAWSKVAV